MDEIFSSITAQITGGLTLDLITVIGGLCFLSLIMIGFAKIQNLFDDFQNGNCEDNLTDLDELRERAEWHSGTARGDILQARYRRGLKRADSNCGDIR